MKLDQLIADPLSAAELSRADIIRLRREAAQRAADLSTLIAVLDGQLAQSVAAPVGNGNGGSPTLLTANEAAQRLGVSRKFIDRHRHELGGVKIGEGTLRFSQADLDRYIRSRRNGHARNSN